MTTSSLIGTGTSSEYNNTIDIYSDTRMQELSVNPGAIAKAVAPVEEEAAIVMTVEKTDKPIKIGTGGPKGTKFSIDWGDGNKVEYEGAKNVTNKPLELYKRQLTASVIPLGAYKSYNVVIGVNASLLRDLKWEQHSLPSYGGGSWY